MAVLPRALALVALSLGLAFCSSEDDTSNVCEPGRQIACACMGGLDGVQKCAADRSGYGPCQCGPDGGTDGSAGAGGAAGAGGSSGGGGTTAGGGGTSSGGGGTSGAGGGGGAAGDGGGTCPAASSTNVTGACDLVAQNCSGALTCRVEQADGGGYVSACVDLTSGTKKLGEACTSHSQCAAKSFCALSKCTRPCCYELEATLCGTGQCDMSINYGGGAFVNVCTFSAACTPWSKDCPAGPETDCHIGSGGKLKCSYPSYAADAGTTIGKPCKYLNDCADSQQCDYSGQSGVCRWLCKASASGGPDAGTVGGAPGNGGCEAGEKCVAYSNPSWLGICKP